jgi:hypothetical protein
MAKDAADVEGKRGRRQRAIIRAAVAVLTDISEDSHRTLKTRAARTPIIRLSRAESA